jgi:endonuclease III
MTSKKEIISKVNRLLVKRFGIPARAKNFPDPLDLLIATILSQNTNDNNSFKAFRNLKTCYDSWDLLIGVKRTSVEKLIRVAGLGRAKSEAIKNVVAKLCEERGEVSLSHIEKMTDTEAVAELTRYKGVGVKTASCVLLFALGRNICPVDTHVHRTVNRIGIVSGKTPDKTFASLNSDFPAETAHSFHTNLIRLGREICLPTKPRCGICPLVKICLFPAKDRAEKREGKKREFMLLDNISK